jgi:hypothetical protein
MRSEKRKQSKSRSKRREKEWHASKTRAKNQRILTLNTQADDKSIKRQERSRTNLPKIKTMQMLNDFKINENAQS